ncbi:MAG: aminotransferase class I/II-fold pyridoxal phosphate-dependent enzyme, partial [Sphingobacterium sp.]
IANADRIAQIMRFKSNMDSGMFLPLQLAAAKALQLEPSWYEDLNKEYSQRREKVYEILDLLGCTYRTDQVGLFVWARIPAHVENGYQLSDDILYNKHVFITPGAIFGSAGDPYIRISLCAKQPIYQEVIDRIKT